MRQLPIVLKIYVSHNGFDHSTNQVYDLLIQTATTIHIYATLIRVHPHYLTTQHGPLVSTVEQPARKRSASNTL